MLNKKWISLFSSLLRPRDYVIKGFSAKEGFRVSFVDNSQALKKALVMKITSFFSISC